MDSEDLKIDLKALELAILKINNSYLDWAKVRDINLSVTGCSNKAVWDRALANRQQGFTRSLQLGTVQLTWSVSNDMESVLSELDVHIAGGKSIMALMDQKNDHRYLVNAWVDETMASAQLAGFPVTKKLVKELLLKRKTTTNQTEQAVINLSKCLQKIKEWQSEAFSETRLLELHQLLTKDTIKLKGIGRYRTNNKYDIAAIEEIKYCRAIDAKDIKSSMQWLITFINEEKHPFYIHPVIKASIINYLITHIRPFKDGNGRMARFLAYWYLLKHGYWAMEYMSLSNVITRLKPQYNKTFRQVQGDEDMGYFIHFMVQSIRMAYRSLKDSLQRTNKEKELNPFVKISGFNLRQAAALQWINEEAAKIITIRELRSGFGVSKETARTDLTALVEQGWLKFYHLNKKTYAFIKGEAFDQLMHEKFNHQ